MWFLLAGLALQVDSPSSGSSFRTSGRSPTSGWSPLRTPGRFLLQDSLPFAIHLSSFGADLDENGPPVMNQIARGGYSLTPPEGGTTRVPLASGLRSQTPPSSSTLPGRFEPPTPRPCVGTEMGIRPYFLDDKVQRIRWRRPSPFVVSDGPSGGCRDSVDPHLTHTQ